MKHYLALLAALAVAGCGAHEESAETPVASTETEIAQAVEAVEAVAAAEVKHVTSAEAKVLLAENGDIVILDVRTPEEFADGHLPNAVNVDFRANDFAQRIAELDREKTYLVHCQSGGRSGKSLDAFGALLFKNIVHLDDGYGGWVKADGETTTD
jgi:rhodanese-related sulfurtransferase